MRIAHVIDYLPQSARYQEYSVAEHQARAGHDVVIITSDRVPRLFRRIDPKPEPGSCRVTKNFQLVRLRTFFEGFGVAVYMPSLGRVIRNFKPDAVHCHGLIYKLSLFQVSRLKRHVDFSLLIDVHESAYNTSPRSNVLKRMFHFVHRRAIERVTLPLVDHLVAVGEDERDFVCTELDISRETVHLIPLGVDCGRFRPSPDSRRSTRALLGLSDEVVVIHTGKINSQKDLHVLVRGLVELMKSCRRNLRVRLLVVGREDEPGYGAALQKLADESGQGDMILWREYGSEGELANFFRAGDIAAWPGLPSISILQAMSSGLPLILPSNLAHSALYTQNQNGLVFSRGNSDQLAQALAVLMDIKARQEMGRRSRELAMSRFSWESISSEFIALYQERVASPMARPKLTIRPYQR